MTNERIDTAIATLETVNPDVKAETVVSEPEKVDVAATEELKTEAIEPTDGENPEADDLEVDVPFPKKAVNALSRRDKQIGKLRAQNEAMQAQLAEFQSRMVQQPQAQPVKQGPQEEEFDNYGEFLKAQIKYEMSQEQTKEQPKQEQYTPEQVKQIIDYNNRVEVVEKQRVELQTSIPDYMDVMTQYEDVIDAAPQPLVDLFLQADNPALAAYNLAKQGKLESLLDMPLNRAAIEIGKALAMGVQTPKKVTAAPAPLKAMSGSGSVAPSLESMSYNQMRDWLKK